MNGILNIDKPGAWTSHDVVAKLRATVNLQRIGHTGTLDPAATGVLVVCLGKATRIAEYLVEWEKEYRAVLRLGETTNTQDGTGTVLSRHNVGPVTLSAILPIIERFTGPVLQTPPMHSAVKVHGTPLHKFARLGKTVPRKAREVLIRHIQVREIHGPDVTFDVVCSKGTYIRTLCADIGDAMGVGGHLHQLVRLRVGPFRREHALTMDDIQELYARGRLHAHVHRPDDVLGDFPAVDVDGQTATRVRHGGAIRVEEVTPTQGVGMAGMFVRVRELRTGLLAVGRLLCSMGELGRPGDHRTAVCIEKVLV